MIPTAYWLTNVRLETGYGYDNGAVIETKTALLMYRSKMVK